MAWMATSEGSTTPAYPSISSARATHLTNSKLGPVLAIGPPLGPALTKTGRMTRHHSGGSQLGQSAMRARNELDKQSWTGRGAEQIKPLPPQPPRRFGVYLLASLPPTNFVDISASRRATRPYELSVVLDLEPSPRQLITISWKIHPQNP